MPCAAADAAMRVLKGSGAPVPPFQTLLRETSASCPLSEAGRPGGGARAREEAGVQKQRERERPGRRGARAPVRSRSGRPLRPAGQPRLAWPRPGALPDERLIDRSVQADEPWRRLRLRPTHITRRVHIGQETMKAGRSEERPVSGCGRGARAGPFAWGLSRSRASAPPLLGAPGAAARRPGPSAQRDRMRKRLASRIWKVEPARRSPFRTRIARPAQHAHCSLRLTSAETKDRAAGPGGRGVSVTRADAAPSSPAWAIALRSVGRDRRRFLSRSCRRYRPPGEAPDVRPHRLDQLRAPRPDRNAAGPGPDYRSRRSVGRNSFSKTRAETETAQWCPADMHVHQDSTRLRGPELEKKKVGGKRLAS